MNIRGLYKTSLIDFPGRISAVLFTGGCNLRCRNCHNPKLAENSRDLDLFGNSEILDVLNSRKNLIDGVTITGGEPTLSKNLLPFIERVKNLPLQVKLDSNGLRPDVIRQLTGRGLLDYVAIDIKTSPQKYNDLTRNTVDFSTILRTINILKESGTDFELRTTCIPGYVTLDDLRIIKDLVGAVEKYFLQQFISSSSLIDESMEHIQPYPVKVLQEFRDFICTFSNQCEIRGI